MDIQIDGLSRQNWLRTIVANLNPSVDPTEFINIQITSISRHKELEPFHLVLLACFIHNLQNKGFKGRLNFDNDDVNTYFGETLELRKYFVEHENYIKAKDNTVLNLWKIKDDEKETYSQQVHDYLKNSFFQNKDLSAIKNSLIEGYYNIFDHADAHDNAYSFIKYEQNEAKLYVAICDFGIGIASSIRSKFEVKSDKDAISLALEPKITVKSKEYNGGFGLGNILSILGSEDKLRIVSNSGFLFAVGNKIKTFDLDFCFKGTLVYYEISLSQFVDLELNEMMSFD